MLRSVLSQLWGRPHIEFSATRRWYVWTPALPCGRTLTIYILVMKKEETYVEQPVEARPPILGRLSWGAIFAGVFMTLVTAIMLSLLGIGVGAGSIEPLKEQQPLSGLGIGTLIWLA